MMSVSSVSSSSSAAAALAAAPKAEQAQPVRGARDGDKDDAATPNVQAQASQQQPTVNTQGQRVGQVINTSA